MNNNIFPFQGSIQQSDRHCLNGHRSALVWFTGLSGSGKSTLAHALEERLFNMGIRIYVLDGDNIRCTPNRDLRLIPNDMKEKSAANIGIASAWNPIPTIHKSRCDPVPEKVVLVMDNLNTHNTASLYAVFPPEEARCMAERLEIHYTPKHGSWLDIAEIELSVLKRQCLAG